MQQRANLVNPRLHVEAASAVRHHDGLPEFYVGHVLDQLILKFRELEWPVITFTIMLVVCPHADNHRIVLGEVSRRLQRGPAQLNTQKTTNTAPGFYKGAAKKTRYPVVIQLHAINITSDCRKLCRKRHSWPKTQRRQRRRLNPNVS